MSRLRGPWGVLGIDPTTDQTAIRRAYAARLKAIDADRDPQAFIELRDAFEQARDQATWSDFEDEEIEAEAGEFDAVPLPIVDLLDRPDPVSESRPAPARSPWAPPRPKDFDAHAAALLELFDRPHDAPQWPDAEEAGAMLAHWRVLSADPRLQQIAYFADAEQWFAQLLARHSPFSDPLVGPVTQFFGWMATAGEVGQSPAVAFVAQRCHTLDFAEAVGTPGHPLHRAWIELTTPAGEHSRRGRVPRRDVERLIETVRRDVPDLEGNFDGYRVSLWTGKKDRGWIAMIGWWIFVVAALQLANLTKCTADQAPAPAPIFVPSTLEDARADSDRVLFLLFSGKLDMATVKARNPDLEQAILRQWTADRRAGVTPEDYIGSLRGLLDDRFEDGLVNAPVDLLRERQRFKLTEIAHVRGDGVEACARYIGGEKVETRLPPPPMWEEQRRALVMRVLLETRPSAKPRPKETRFAVPRDVIDASAKRAGQDRDTLVQALLFKGPAQAQCDGRVAFIETVLALPDKRAERLLRAM
jgi:hypothetical protein